MSENRSSEFVQWGVLIVFGILGIAARIYHLRVLSAALLMLCLLCTLSRLWSDRALKDVHIRVTSEPAALFPGGEVEQTVRIRNDKLLPLLWLEVCRGGDSREASVSQGLQRRFTFVMGHEEITWSNRWKALRRGIFRPGELQLRSGDAFGLAMTEGTADSADTGTVAVYPALQPVSSDLFLQSMWEISGGGGGYLEDPALTRSTRDYTPTDSVRNINWRLTARTQRTIVNIRETILPRSALFILDCGSFLGRGSTPTSDSSLQAAGSLCGGLLGSEGENEAFEDTLSILTSLIRQLNESGIVCGAALPAGGTSPSCILYNRETTPLRDILYAFAGYELPPAGSSGCGLPTEQILSLPYTGKICYVCLSPDSITDHRLLQRLDPGRTTVLPYRNRDHAGETSGAAPSDKNPTLPVMQALELTRLKKGGLS